MSSSWADDLDSTLKRIEARPLFVMQLNVKPIVRIGATPA